MAKNKAKTSETQAIAKKGPHRFKKGESGNPRGLPSHVIKIRRDVRAALDEAFAGDGHDRLIEALVDGVARRDATCLRLACEYRWGKPAQRVELEEVKRMDREQVIIEMGRIMQKIEEADGE